MSRASFARAVVVIAIGAVALRVAYVFLLGARPALGSDGTWYALQAGTIADGVGYVDPRRYYATGEVVATAQFPPLWPGVLSLVYEVGLGGLRSYRITGGVIGSVTVVLTGYLGRSLAGTRAGLVAAGIVALSPFLIAADGSLMAESLFIALTTGAVLAAVRARRTAGVGWFALVGFLLGLATLTRSDGLIVAAVLVPVAAWCSGGTAWRRGGLGALAILVALATLLPWAIRSTKALDQVTILSNNSGSLISGANCRVTYEGRRLAGWDVSCVPDPAGLDESERAAEQRQAGFDYAREHWTRAVLVGPLRAIRGWGLWSPVALIDAEDEESRTRSMQAVGWVASLAVLALAAWGTVVMVRAGKEVALLLAMVGAATLILVTSWGNQRFRLVAEPELAVLAAAALTHAWTRLQRSLHVRPASEQVSVQRTGEV